MSVLWQQRTHGVQRQKEQQIRTAARFFLLIVVVLLVLAAAYVALAAENVKLGERVWQHEMDLVKRERGESDVDHRDCAVKFYSHIAAAGD